MGKPGSTGTRIPSLDGLRAVSILLVVAYHQYKTGAVYSKPITLHEVLWNHGVTGVSIFFVISGFLITRLLLNEEDKRGSISLKNFYLRRAFRILPPFYAYLFVVLVLGILGIEVVQKHHAIRAALFVYDYYPGAWSWLFSHTWSLSVEEQFYLLWPPTLVILGRRNCRRVALALIMLAPACRILSCLLLSRTYSLEQIGLTLHTRVDMLMFGCLLALMYDSEVLNRYVASLRWPVVAALACFAVFGTAYLTARFGLLYLYLIGLTLQGASIATVLLWTVKRPATLAGRFLNWRVMVHIEPSLTACIFGNNCS